MAKIKGPLNSIQASGSVGAVTYRRNQYGAYSLAYHASVQPDSADQISWRDAMAAVNTAWSDPATVTGSKRQKWYGFAEAFTWHDRFGNTIHLKAKEWFTRLNVYRARAGLSILTTPPSVPGTNWSPEVDFYWDTDGIYCECWPRPASTQFLYISKIAAMNGTRFSPPNTAGFGAIFSSASVAPLKIWDAADIDTDPHAWFFRVICIDTLGRPSNPVWHRVYTTGSAPTSLFGLQSANQIRPANPTTTFLDQSNFQFAGSNIASPKTNMTDLLQISLGSVGFSKTSKCWIYLKGNNDGTNPNREGFLLYDTLVSYINTEVTWNRAAVGTDWSVPGGAAGVDYETNPFFGWNLEVITDKWYRYDITAQMNIWLDTVSTAQMWVIASSADANGVFYSTGAASADDKPYIICIPNVET